MDRYWPDLSESVYAMWFYFDFELPAGGRIADLFHRRNWQLSPGERRPAGVTRFFGLPNSEAPEVL